jgi:hypothetical protein
MLRRKCGARHKKVMGQTRKNSVRAYVFRFAPELGHCSMQAALRSINSGHSDAGSARPKNVKAGLHPARRIEQSSRAMD